MRSKAKEDSTSKFLSFFRIRNETKEHDIFELSPQVIQRSYPRYKELVKDLKHVTVGLREYTEWLARIAQLRAGVARCKGVSR